MPTELHAALQQHYAGDTGRVEAVTRGFRVDALREGVAYEIQTGSFHKIRDKVAALAELIPVVVVYPLVDVKTIVRVDPQTGDQLSARRSPKRGSIIEAFSDLRSIAGLLARENVSLHIVRTVERETRCDDRKGSRWRKGVSIVDRELVEIVETLYLDAPADYLQFLPPNLPQRFTVGDLAQAIGASRWHAGHMAFTLRQIGAIRQVSKQGNAFVYEAVGSAQERPLAERQWIEVRCSQCDLLACEAHKGSRIRWRCQGCGSLEVWAAGGKAETQADAERGG